MPRFGKLKKNKIDDQLYAALVADKMKRMKGQMLEKAKQNDGATLFYVAKKYAKRKSHDKALAWFKKAEAQNINEARRQLGDIFFNGLGVKIDYKEAMAWYLKSVNNGRDAMSQYSIGNMYLEGMGVPKDLQNAIDWFTRSANQGYTPAQTCLSQIYEHTEEVRDLQKAVNWVNRAAECGNYKMYKDLKRLNEKGYYSDEQERVIFKALAEVKNEVVVEKKEEENEESVDGKPTIIEILDSEDEADLLINNNNPQQQTTPLTKQKNENKYKLLEEKMKALTLQIEQEIGEKEELQRKVASLEKEKVRKEVLMEQEVYLLEQGKTDMEMEIRKLHEALRQSGSTFDENPKIDIYYNS